MDAGDPAKEAGDIDPARFRATLASLPTGVAVVTAHGSGGPVGMAANSISSVSLSPPLILLCAAKTSTTWPEIRAAEQFCVNVLADHHEAVAERFAAHGLDRFATVEFESRATGPVIPDAVAWIECRLLAEHDAGDHTIAVANVLGMEAASDVEPLVFFRGAYGSVRMPPCADA